MTSPVEARKPLTQLPKPIRLWDLPTRLFHWLLVALIALQFASGEFGMLPMRWHYLMGYTTLALIVFRVLWGFFGSQTSRFSYFLHGPRAVMRYVIDSMRGSAPHAPGHNPLGGWSVVLMLAVVAVQAVSGLFTSDDISEEGPFVAHVSDATVKLMTRIHHLDRYALLFLIALHVGAVLLHWVIRKDNLVAPMLHGNALATIPEPRFVSSWRALILFALCAGAVWALVAWSAAG